jgi:putative selenate reductase
MSDILRIQPFDLILRRILREYEATRSIFGIHESLFYRPRADAPYAQKDLYGQLLSTPIGPSAGPHTQLSQNIVAAWICGGRFVELKTVQVMDELVIPRPCIDMADEGYNVEWSQELKLHESAQEYINAWALLHILPRVLGWEGLGTGALGTIFDMSVGYNLEGILSPTMQRFMDQMADASAELGVIRATLERDFPQFAGIEIPSRLVNSMTLSTMHGCPPDEIERIARYMLEERRLHTIVKLNPTLLGKEGVLSILHDSLGFTEIEIPDSVFEHDLAWDKALGLIGRLQETAVAQKLAFGVKLSNTLAMHNHREVMPGGEMYMSGRALYPVTMNLFNKLAHVFPPDPATGYKGLRVSYSAGADALNIATVLSCGALPVTACSDLLKPGGYARFGQWLEKIEAAMAGIGAASLAEFSKDRLANVEAAASESLTDPRYKKSYTPHGLPKVPSGLGLWDCIVAPCMEQCAVCQDVPEYAWWIAEGDPDKSLQVILSRNPLPGITGYVCTRLCQTRCTRNDYEETIAIRALKRYAEEHGKTPRLEPRPATGKRVAVIGSGPAGFSAAYYLALSGVDVTILEAKDVLGGMARMVPVFRLPWEIIQRDVDTILKLGVTLKLNSPVTKPPEALLEDGYDAVFVAAGFQRDARLEIPGIEGPGVHAALSLLDRTRRGERVELGRSAVVIGGGDTAMDATRTSHRLTGNPTTIVYRRTEHEMPCSPEELEGALEEGNKLEELASPVRVIREDGKVTALECLRNRLGEPGPDGRRRPVEIPGSEFRIPCDSVVVAVGQSPEFQFMAQSKVGRTRAGGIAIDHATGATAVPGVYAGGDGAESGPDSIIAACDDGRRAAEAICRQLGLVFGQPSAPMPALTAAEINDVKKMRARKELPARSPMIPIARRDSFDVIELTLSHDEARREAARCVQCTTFCDKCVEVCPNRANQTFLMEAVRTELPLLGVVNGRLAAIGKEPFAIAQTRQILNINDFCNECGDCVTFCVHEGRPFAEKPRLFLGDEDYEKASDNAFRIRGETIFRREGGRESRLTRAGGNGAFARALVYENDQVRVTLTPALQVVEMQLLSGATAPAEPVSLVDAAEMAVLFKGIAESLPQLLVE